MKKYLVTWSIDGECLEAKIYAHDMEEAQEIAKQFLSNYDENFIIEEM